MRVRRSHSMVSLTLAAIMLCSLPGVLSQEPRSGSLPGLEAVPAPLLDDFEPAIQDQLRSTRGEVERLLAENGEEREAVEVFGLLCLLYLRYELMDAAEACLEQVRGLQPSDFRWPYFQTMLYARNAELDKARASVEAALALRPDDRPAQLRAGEIYLLLGDEKKAEEIYGMVLQVEPESSALHFGLGRIAASRGETEVAISHYEAALRGQPPGSIVHYHLGMAYRAQGDLDRARAELEKNRQQDITFPDPLASRLNALSVSQEAIFIRGVEARRQGRSRQAIEAFNEVLARDPDDADAHFNLARAQIGLGEMEEAELHLRKAIEARPDFFDAHYNLAILLGRGGRGEEAARHLERAVEIDSEHLPTRVMWAQLLAKQGRGAEAVEELEEVLSIDGATPGALLALAVIQAELGDRQAAARILRQVVDSASVGEKERSEAHLRLALLDRSSMHREEILAHLRAAVEIDPVALQARTILAEELARGGELESAASQFTDLVKLSPNDARAHLGLGMTLILAGSYERALQALEVGLERLPDNQALRHLLARFLATCPEADIRDGERAVLLAQTAIEAQPSLDHAETLAMALAEVGRFEEAVSWQMRVVNQQEAAGGVASASQRRRLELYQQGQPVRAPWLESR